MDAVVRHHHTGTTLRDYEHGVKGYHSRAPSLHTPTETFVASNSFSLPSTPHLPPELWLEVFTNLSAAPADLHAITLTCSLFSALGQPLLFSTLDVCPFFLGYNGSGPILRSHAYLKRTKERIARYTSNQRIRGSVKSVWVSPYPRNSKSSSGAELCNGRRDYLDPALVIQEVVNVLEMFPNLRSLNWHAVEMRHDWWTVISRLRLDTLWVNASSFPALPLPHSPPPTPPPLPAAPAFNDSPSKLNAIPIPHLHLDHWAYNGELMNHVSIAESHTSGVQEDVLTLTVLPSVLETITIPRPSTARLVVELLVQYVNEGALFGKLTKLALPFAVFAASGSYPSSPEDILKALTSCPNLEQLQIYEPAFSRSRLMALESVPTTTLPNLHTFEGPYTFVPAFVDGARPVKRLILWGLDGHGTACDSEKLELVLRELVASGRGACSIESMKVNVSGVSAELVDALYRFEGLRFLSLISASGGSSDSSNAGNGDERFARFGSGWQFGAGSERNPVFQLYDLIRTTLLPPNLESVKISMRLDNQHSTSPVGLDAATQKQEATELLDAMKRGNPKLESVEISYGSYWMGNFCVKWDRRMHDRTFDFGSVVWGGDVGTKEIVEVDVSKVTNRRRMKTQRAGLAGFFGWISNLLSSYLL